MTTKITGSQITEYTVNTEQLSNTTVAAFAKSLAPKITTVNVANSTFAVLDDSAVNVGGGYIVITGSEFQSGASVLIDNTPATSVTYIDSETLRAQIPAKSAASYNLYVVNPDGGTGIRVAGVTYSASPTWVTASPLPNQLSNVSFNVALSATGATSYSNVTSIPAGTTLLANGYFYGTVTVEAETQYTFDVRATDAENQDSDKTFQVTITLIPTYYMYAWGRNESGSLGLNDADSRSSPVQVGTIKWDSLLHTPRRGGQFITHGGIRNDGTLWLWGNNSYGKLGLNDEINRSSPTQVGASTNWLKVATTYRGTTAAIKTDNSLWVWGGHSYGLLAVNVTYPGTKSSPSQVGSTVWSDVSSGMYHFAAVKTNGTLWAWGLNSTGQLGQNNNSGRASSPVQIGASTNWLRVISGYNQNFALTTSNQLFSWGFNNGNTSAAGILGLNSTPLYVGSPTQLAGTNWTANLSTGPYATAAIKSDGTLWTFGGAYDGVKGLNNSSTYNSSPIQVGTATNWKYVSTNMNHMIATKTDGTLWAWGGNSHGRLGLNDTTAKSSPVQVGTDTTWNLVGGSSYASVATKST